MGENDDGDTSIDLVRSMCSTKDLFEGQTMVNQLQEAEWITHKKQQGLPLQETKQSTEIPNLPGITNSVVKGWKADIKQQESLIAHARRNASNPHSQVGVSDAAVRTTDINTGTHTRHKEAHLRTESLHICDCNPPA
jgi:hypothetical protein